MAEYKSNVKIVHNLRMDGPGENQSLEQGFNSSDWKMCPNIEYMARNTPKQNEQAEVAIFTLVKCARALMAVANIPKKYFYRCFPLVVKTCMLDWLLVIKRNNVGKPKIYFGLINYLVLLNI